MINIYAAVTNSIDTLAGSVVRRVVDTLCYGQRGDFLSGLGVEHRNLPAATRHKQSMVCFIDGHCDIRLAIGNRPARVELPFVPLDHLDLVFGLVLALYCLPR